MKKISPLFLALFSILNGMQESSKRPLPDDGKLNNSKRVRLTISQSEFPPLDPNFERELNQLVSSPALAPELNKESQKQNGPEPNKALINSYVCKFCSESFSNSKQLKNHKVSHRSYTCDYPGCGKAFIYRQNLKVHKRIHTGERPYVCGLCNKAFAQSGNLVEHKRIHTGEKPHKCEYPDCNKAFARLDRLNMHKIIHTGERPYKCNYPECDKTFTRSDHLTEHKRKHTGDYLECDKTFTQPTTLNNHKKQHISPSEDVDSPTNAALSHHVSIAYALFLAQENILDKTTLEETCDYSCKVCSTTFTSLDDFKEHCSLMHEEETNSMHIGTLKEIDKKSIGEDNAKSSDNNISLGDIIMSDSEKPHDPSEKRAFGPHTCDYPTCGKTFSQLEYLIKHKRIHTLERPFVCEYPECHKAFTQSSTLTRHKRIHTGERPFTCDYPGCDKAFAYLHVLKEHKRVHTQEMPYRCNYPACNKTFKKLRSLTAHKQTHLRLITEAPEALPIITNNQTTDRERQEPVDLQPAPRTSNSADTLLNLLLDDKVSFEDLSNTLGLEFKLNSSSDKLDELLSSGMVGLEDTEQTYDKDATFLSTRIEPGI